LEITFRTSSYANFAQKMVPLAAKGERRFDQIRFGLSVASPFRKDVVITAPSSVPFSPKI
jgi:hypothetical protein